MGSVLLAAAIALATAVLGGAVSYNRFVTQRNHVRESWATIDTELRRRYDLIPNLDEAVRGYAAHEQRTLEAAIAVRRAAATDQRRLDDGVLVTTPTEFEFAVEGSRFPCRSKQLSTERWWDLLRMTRDFRGRMPASLSRLYR